MLSQEWRELLSLIPGYDSEATAAEGEYFDEDAAAMALAFFPELLQFIEGDKAGQPFELAPFQQAIVAALWGWRRADGTRRYREALIFIPRKAGKSPLAAGLLLLSMFTDGEAGSQLVSAASTKEQAALIFRHASGMIAREPELAKRTRVYRTFKSIEYPAEGTTYKALASDNPGNLHGLNINFLIVDELHQINDPELLEALLTATISRRSPLVIFLTTADYDRPSLCNSKHSYATAVRDRTLEDSSFLPVLFEAPKDADWTDPEVWKAAHPGIGVSVPLQAIAREYKKTLAEPSYINPFRRYFLNQKTSTYAESWITPEAWDACRGEFPDLTGETCYAGLDLASTRDFTALALLFPIDGKVYVRPYFWIPEAKLHEKSDRIPLEVWEREGFVTITPGNVVDYNRIRSDILALGQTYRIADIRYDRWNSSQLVTELMEDGAELTQTGQGFKDMSGPTKEVERLVYGGRLIHDGNPVLKWMMGNVVLELDAAGNAKPTRKRSREKIDGVVASIMAVSGIMGSDDAEPDMWTL